MFSNAIIILIPTYSARVLREITGTVSVPALLTYFTFSHSLYISVKKCKVSATTKFVLALVLHGGFVLALVLHERFHTQPHFTCDDKVASNQWHGCNDR